MWTPGTELKIQILETSHKLYICCSFSQEFVMGLSTLLRGTVREKLEWTFHLYDINKDGFINKEVYHI